MAREVGFRVEGLSAVVRGLKAIGTEVDDLKGAFSAIATEGAEKAAGHVRSRTGRLAGDIRGNRAQSKAVVTAGRASVPYAGPINYGWAARNIEPSSFMQKAADEMEPVAIHRLETEINEQIRKRGMA